MPTYYQHILLLTRLLCVQVVIRVRPPLPRELEAYQPFQNTALVDPGQRKLTVSENAQSIQNGANASDIALVSTHLASQPKGPSPVHVFAVMQVGTYLSNHRSNINL